jgi:cytochrome c553
METLNGLSVLVVVALALCAGPARAGAVGADIFAKGAAGGVPACAACHGSDAQGNDAAGFPRLARLPAPYIRRQLTAFAGGARSNPIMGPIAKMLTARQAEAVAAYLASLPGPSLAKTAPAPAGPGASLALDGRWSDRIPACVSCHGPDGIGVGITFPPLAGQPAAYLKSQLEAFQHDTRPPGPLGLMSAVAKRMSASDIAAASDWFAALRGGAGH